MDQESKKTFWPYAIIIALVLFAGYIIRFVVISMQHDINLVSEDYYEKEIKYQDHIDAVKRSKPFSNGFSVSYQKDKDNFRLVFPSELKGEDVIVQLYRSSDFKQDLYFTFSLKESTVLLLDASELSKGVWEVKCHSYKEGLLYVFEQQIEI